MFWSHRWERFSSMKRFKKSRISNWTSPSPRKLRFLSHVRKSAFCIKKEGPRKFSLGRFQSFLPTIFCYANNNNKKKFCCGTHTTFSYLTLPYLPTLERENNGDFMNDIFWLCMKFKNNPKHLNYRQKDA